MMPVSKKTKISNVAAGQSKDLLVPCVVHQAETTPSIYFIIQKFALTLTDRDFEKHAECNNMFYTSYNFYK